MEHLQRRHRFSYDTFVVGVGSPAAHWGSAVQAQRALAAQGAAAQQCHGHWAAWLLQWECWCVYCSGGVGVSVAGL